MFRAACLEDAVRNLHTLYEREDLLAEDVSSRGQKNCCIDVDSRTPFVTLWDPEFRWKGAHYVVRGKCVATLFDQCKRSLISRYSLKVVGGEERFPHMIEEVLKTDLDTMQQKFESFRVFFKGEGNRILEDLAQLKLVYHHCHPRRGEEVVVFVRSFDPFHVQTSHQRQSKEKPAISHTLEPLAFPLDESLYLHAPIAEFECYSMDHIKCTDGVTSAIQREKGIFVRLEDVMMIMEAAPRIGYLQLVNAYTSTETKIEALQHALAATRSVLLNIFAFVNFGYFESFRLKRARMEIARCEQELEGYRMALIQHEALLPPQILLREPLLKVQFYGVKADLTKAPQAG